jgi:hypothetical protein
MINEAGIYGAVLNLPIQHFICNFFVGMIYYERAQASTYSIIIKVVSSAVQFNALAVNFNFRTLS